MSKALTKTLETALIRQNVNDLVQDEINLLELLRLIVDIEYRRRYSYNLK